MLVYFIEFLETPYQTKNNKGKVKPKPGKTRDTGGKRNVGEGCHN